MLLIHLQELPTHLRVHSTTSHILCKGREPPALQRDQGPKSSESLLFLQRTFISSGSITDFQPAESPLPPNLLVSLVHGKMQPLSRFPAAFPGYPMQQYLADHFPVHSVCWLQGKETTMRSLGKMVCFFFFPSDLACRVEIQECGQQTASRDSRHPLRKLKLNSFSLIHENKGDDNYNQQRSILLFHPASLRREEG